MFKVGDKVVCINKNFDSPINYNNGIKLYKTYIIDITYDLSTTIVLKGINNLFNSKYFISLLEYRKQKIEKICSKLEIK